MIEVAVEVCGLIMDICSQPINWDGDREIQKGREKSEMDDMKLRTIKISSPSNYIFMFDMNIASSSNSVVSILEAELTKQPDVELK